MLKKFGVVWLMTAAVALSVSETTNKDRVYRGSIAESAAEGDEVLLNIPLSVSNRDGLSGDEVCGYTIYKWHPEVPFKVVLLDRKTGDAKIVLTDDAHLDYELKRKYSFDIAAYDCQTGTHAARERVNIYVDDANEFSPAWNEPAYSGVVDEGLDRQQVVQIQATDADGSPGMSKICQYHIMTPGVPFDIDELGVVRNTEPLDVHKMDHYSFQVKAEDCGGRVSDDVVVNVDVKATCRRGLTGISDVVEVVDSSRHRLMPDVSLSVCDVSCQPERVSVTVRLETSHIGRGCDRDQFTLKERRQICGASADYVDLLPDPTTDGSWTSELPTVDDVGDDLMFVFDGQSTAVELPAGELDPRRLGTSFSISTWMKHERGSNDAKEHIVCAADGEGMNRHHYALFVHKCRLVLLLRHEPEVTSDDDVGTTDDTLSAAEWRWKLPEVCDGKWHHYVISVESLEVRLHLDGRTFVPTDNEPEVLDDWPLHKSKLVHSTKLYVGACWQGAKNSPGQYFRGYLSGLAMMRNRTDTDDAIECLNRCEERLELSAADVIDTGMSVSINAAMSLVTVNGYSVDSVQKLVRQINYVNTRLFPTPAVRPLSVEAHVKCADGRQPSYDVISASVDVAQTDALVLNLNGTTALGRDEGHILIGEKIFSDVVITARQKTGASDQLEDVQNYEVDDVSDRLRVGTCHVHIEPPLNLDLEHVTFPADLTGRLDMVVAASESGLTISGPGKVTDYEQMLRQVRYVNTKPHDFNHRSFVLGCTEAGGHLTSNLMHVSLDVIRTVHEKAPAPHHVMKESKTIMTDSLHLVGKSFPGTLKYDSQQTGVGVAVVMVVCVGFIVVLVVLGVMRVRNAKRCGSGDASDDRQDLDWDNSALTITVNPMDPDNADGDDQDGVGCTDDEDSDECDSDDGVVYRDSAAVSPCAAAVERNRKLQRCDWRKDGSTLIL